MARVPIATTDRDEFGGMRRQFSGRKTDGQEATNALVAKWRSSHAAGPRRYDEWRPTAAASRAATNLGIACRVVPSAHSTIVQSCMTPQTIYRSPENRSPAGNRLQPLYDEGRDERSGRRGH